MTQTLKPDDFVYVMSAYSHTDVEVRQLRYNTATLISAYLTGKYGCKFFSPITHSHPVAEYHLDQISHEVEIPDLGWNYWMSIDLPILEKVATCGVVIVSPGWLDSKGVLTEIEKLTELGKPVYTLDIETLALLPLDIDAYRTGVYSVA